MLNIGINWSGGDRSSYLREEQLIILACLSGQQKYLKLSLCLSAHLRSFVECHSLYKTGYVSVCLGVYSERVACKFFVRSPVLREVGKTKSQECKIPSFSLIRKISYELPACMLKAGQINKYTCSKFKQGILQNGLFHHKVDGYKEVSICYNKILIILMCV